MIDHLGGKWLVVCTDNKGNEASLERWKIYWLVPTLRRGNAVWPLQRPKGFMTLEP